jgi:hypothetical protein
MTIPEPTWTLQELVQKAVTTQRCIHQSAITARRRAKASENLTVMSGSDMAHEPFLDNMLTTIKEVQFNTLFNSQPRNKTNFSWALSPRNSGSPGKNADGLMLLLDAQHVICLVTSQTTVTHRLV